VAIFGKADANLPVLTQVMQADTESEEEMKALWFRLASIAQARLTTLLPSVGWEPGDRATVPLDNEVSRLMAAEDTKRRATLTKGEDATEEEKEVVWNDFKHEGAKFAEACQLVQGILEALYERSMVRGHDLNKLGEMSYKTGMHPDLPAVLSSMVPTEDPNKIQTPEEIPLSVYLPGEFAQIEFPVNLIASEIEGLLLSLWRGKVRLARCVECNNVFIVAREGHIYCSHRCNTRVLQRERRRKIVYG